MTLSVPFSYLHKNICFCKTSYFAGSIKKCNEGLHLFIFNKTVEQILWIYIDVMSGTISWVENIQSYWSQGHLGYFPARRFKSIEPYRALSSH